MDSEKMIPLSCNHFGIGTNNGLTFIFEFRFQEPPQQKGGQGSMTTIARIALDRIGAERLRVMLEKTLNNTKGAISGTPPKPQEEFEV